MKFALPLLLSVLLFAYGAFGQRCELSWGSHPRQGGLYQSGDGWDQIYDLVFTNYGGCPIETILLSISAQNITEVWDLSFNGTFYEVTGFGDLLPGGNTVNAGFIGYFATQALAVSATVMTVELYCPNCIYPSISSSSSATTSSSSTSASTTASTASTTASSSTSSTGSSTSCHLSSTITPRANSEWQSGTGVSQIYDVIIVNDGSCGVNDITLQLSLPSGASISSSWNLNGISGLQYSVTSFGDVLPIGATVNAGFVALFSNTQTVPTGVSATVTEQCNSCSSSSSSGSTSVSSTTASTSSSSSSATSVTSSTSTSSSTSSSTGSSSSNVVVTLTPRANSSYLNGSGIFTIFDFSTSNLGACGVTNIDVTISIPAGGSISSSWNIALISGNEYSVTNFGGNLLQGQTATSGFIAFFPNTLTVPSGTTLTLASPQSAC